jgi:hypothetical protein
VRNVTGPGQAAAQHAGSSEKLDSLAPEDIDSAEVERQPPHDAAAQHARTQQKARELTQPAGRA